MNRRLYSFVILGLLIAASIACGSDAPDVTEVAQVQSTAAPTATPTTRPTATTQPTATVTQAPAPTATDAPTATPTPLPVPQAITTAAITLRTGPDEAFDGVRVPNGTVVTLLAGTVDGRWFLAQLDDGTTGWLPSAYLRLVAGTDLASVPVAATLPATPTAAATNTPRPTATAAATATPRPTNRPTAAPTAAGSPTVAVPSQTATAAVTATTQATATLQPTATTPPPAPGVVAITYIFYDGNEPQYEGDEYAVITNQGGSPVNLSGYRLNADDPGQDFWFPNFELQPGQSCRVYTDENHPEYCGFNFGSGSAIWANSGECGHLFDASGAEVSTYCY